MACQNQPEPAARPEKLTYSSNRPLIAQTSDTVVGRVEESPAVNDPLIVRFAEACGATIQTTQLETDGPSYITLWPKHAPDDA